MESIEAFLNYLLLEKKYSQHTIISYRNDLMSFYAFSKKEFDSSIIEKAHYPQIRTWIVYLVKNGISNNTVNRKISSLRSF